MCQTYLVNNCLAQKRALVLKAHDSDLKVPKSRLDRNNYYATC